MSYPTNYGFILGTKGEDGDALDVLLISSRPIIPGAILKARVIGMFEMEDEGGIDQKILCVPASKIDQKFASIECFKDLEKITLQKIVHFFKYYKDLEKGKWVKIQDDCKSKEMALELIKKSQI
jgi:inorganic pyrophosphatase